MSDDIDKAHLPTDIEIIDTIRRLVDERQDINYSAVSVLLRCYDAMDDDLARTAAAFDVVAARCAELGDLPTLTAQAMLCAFMATPALWCAPHFIKCPGCDTHTDENDLLAQGRHLEEHHPEIIEERRREVARFAGWENG